MRNVRDADERLAIEGGAAVRTTPLPRWPTFEEEEIEAAASVLRSGKVNYWTGTRGQAFEREFARLCGCRYAVALSNGSVALELALEALGIGPGDEVVVTCRSFIASATCCLRRGAVPVFADVDPVSQNMTAETVRAVLSRRTRAIIAVHLAGWPCEMDEIMRAASDHGLHVIEDCAQALGATYRGRPVGSLGHVGVFSFCQDKILTTGGEGGMLTTNELSIWKRAWSLKDHGKDWQAARPNGDASVFRWLHHAVGTNYRMTEIQAAIGRAMLRKLPRWLAIRRRNAAALNDRLGRLPQLRVTLPPDHVQHGYYKYYVFLRPEWLRVGWSRDRILRAVQAEGIPCGSGICAEIYRERAFEGSPSRPLRPLPVARELGNASLMLPVHPTLSDGDLVDACRAVEKVVRRATLRPPIVRSRAA